MSNKPACEVCRFASPERGYRQHQCRRNAPTVRTVPAHIDLREHVPVWPIVQSNDWCGKFKTALTATE